MKAYFAELLGAFSLALAVSISLSSNFPVPTPFIAALVLGIFVYTVGSLSGAHLNPAVTIAAASIGTIKPSDAVFYVIAQLAGGMLAGYVSHLLIPAALVSAGNGLLVFSGEAIGCFFLAFGVASVIYGKTPRDASGVVVGGSLLIGISIAAAVGNAALNPAVALAIGSMTPAYALGPVVGAVVAMWLYGYIFGERLPRFR
jgi:glycerol uptake facilitator-like aquaporin